MAHAIGAHSGSNGKRVLLAGATGYSGRQLARELLRRGYQVTALVRKGSGEGLAEKLAEPLADHPGGAHLQAQQGVCDVLEIDLTEPQADCAQLGKQAFSVVASCATSRSGVPSDAWAVDYQLHLNLLQLAQGWGTQPHFLLLSAICVQRPLLEFQRAKLAFEAKLAAADLPYTVVRPTAFFKSLAGQVERVLAGKPYLYFGDGALTACKPIAQEDLAQYMADCLEDPACRNQVLPIGGPGPALTPREQGELLFAVAGREPRFRSVPAALFTGLGSVLRPLSKVSRRLADKAELLKIGHYYATESMLVWDEQAGGYSAAATPEYGTQTLEAFYTRVVQQGLAGEELGAHKLF